MTERVGGAGSRRVRLPAADELFRPTVVAPEAPRSIGPSVDAPTDDPDPSAGQGRAPSGRVRHDEKMTVYVTSEELLDIEDARLSLRRSGLSVDRGRLVREAVAIALADLETNGRDSALVARLTGA